jgi:hypothetical protein
LPHQAPQQAAVWHTVQKLVTGSNCSLLRGEGTQPLLLLLLMLVLLLLALLLLLVVLGVLSCSSHDERLTLR